MMYFGCRRRRLEPKKVDAPCAMGRRRPFNPSTKVLILLANYHCYHFLAKDSINSNARFSSAEIIMLFSVSYSTMLFLLLLIFLSPRSFLILLAVIAIICTVLENFVKLRFFNSQPQYVRLGFGTWCFSSSIISIAVYFGLCFIDLIRTWLGQFIQLCLYRLHFPHLICIAVLGFLVLNGPKLWAAVSTWNSSNKSMMTSEQSSTTAEVDSYDRSSHRLQPKFVKKEGDGGHPSIQVADMVQVARFSPRLLKSTQRSMKEKDLMQSAWSGNSVY